MNENQSRTERESIENRTRIDREPNENRTENERRTNGEQYGKYTIGIVEQTAILFHC